MYAPHSLVRSGEIAKQQIFTINWLYQGRMPQGIVTGWSASQCRVANDFTSAHDTGIAGIHRIYQSRMTLYPLAFPTHLHHGVILKMGRAPKNGLRMQTQQYSRT
jgi:hypothetical protein